MQEIWVQFLGQEDPLEQEMVTLFSILAWRIPMDRGAWQATVHGVTESDTAEHTHSQQRKHKKTPQREKDGLGTELSRVQIILEDA